MTPLLSYGLVSRRGHKANFTVRLFHRNCNGGLTTPTARRGGGAISKSMELKTMAHVVR